MSIFDWKPAEDRLTASETAAKAEQQALTAALQAIPTRCGQLRDHLAQCAPQANSIATATGGSRFAGWRRMTRLSRRVLSGNVHWSTIFVGVKRLLGQKKEG